MSQIEDINRKYYDGLYRRKPFIFQLIHPYISFDQQSKSRFNCEFVKRLFSDTNKNIKYLDYGFGHGSLILKMPQKDDLYGCDISVHAVQHFPKVAKFYGKRVKTFTPDQIDDFVESSELDLISLSHVLEHVDDDAMLLKSLVTKLKVGGHVLVNLPINELVEDPKHVRKYDMGSVKKLMENCGLKIVKIQEMGRLGNFFAYHERHKKCPKIFLPFFRVLRSFFAVCPAWFYSIIETSIKNIHKNGQILALGIKK